MAAIRSSIRNYRLFSTTISPVAVSATKANLPSEQDPFKSIELNDIDDLKLKRLVRSRRFDDIESLIESKKKDPRITQEDFISKLIRSYGMAGMADNASRLYNQMEELGTPRSSLSFNALLSAYNMSQKSSSMVRMLFDEIPKRHGFSPDKVSYAILIKSICGSSKPASALSILKEMEKKNIEITTQNYTTILDALYRKGKVNEAETVWNEMIAQGLSLDVATYNVRIMHGTHQGKTPSQDVLALIDEMRKAGFEPDTTTYNYLFTCYCKDGMIDRAEQVYQNLEKNGCSPNSATFRLVIFNLCKVEEFRKAYEVFKESMKRDKIPTFRVLKILVEGLVKTSNVEDAKEVIRTMNEKFGDNPMNNWKELEAQLGLNNDQVSLH